MADRYVLLGLARPRSEWFRSVARWATAASLPAEFTKCVSAEEVRARLAAGRQYSAALLDGGLPQVDRDLLAAVRDAGSVPLVVDDGRIPRDWLALGADAVIPSGFTREQLLEVLTARCSTIGVAYARTAADDGPGAVAAPGSVVAVVGPGGTGSSTAAIALAQALGRDPQTGPVVLADLCRNGEQAMLHDARDVFPGLQELVDAHRSGHPSLLEIRASCFKVEERNYHLLLGLRRARHWSLIRPRAFEAAFASLRQVFRIVVCDIDGDVESEDDGGSVEVEERNLLARTAALSADVVFTVGHPGMKGLHSLVRLISDLVAGGVAPAAIVPVLNQAPRQPKQRASLAASFGFLAQAATDGARLPSPVFLPRRRVDDALRDGVAMPSPLPALLAGAYRAAVQRQSAPRPLVPAELVPQRIAPGSLGVGPPGGPAPELGGGMAAP